MVLRAPGSHIPPCFADHRDCSHDIDPVNAGQIGPGHAKQLSPVNRTAVYCLAFFWPPFPCFLRQLGPSAAVLPLLQILLQSLITFQDLFLAKLIAIVFLLQLKQKVLLPVTLQTACNLLLSWLSAADI